MGCPWPPRMGLRWPVGTGNSLHFLAWKSTCGTQAAYFILLPVFAFVYGCIHQYVLLLIIHISVAVLPCNRLKSFFSKITTSIGETFPFQLWAKTPYRHPHLACAPAQSRAETGDSAKKKQQGKKEKLCYPHGCLSVQQRPIDTRILRDNAM